MKSFLSLILVLFFLFVFAFAWASFAQANPAANASQQVPAGQIPASQIPVSQIPVDQENVRKAKAVLDQAIQALGGQAYLNIQDISQEGRTFSFFHGQPSSYGIQFWRFYKYPDKDRVELTKKRDVIYVNNGDKGYEITYKGTRAADAKDLADYNRRRQFTLDWVLRHWVSDPGVALFYEGAAVAADKPADQVTLINAKNQGVTLFIDRSRKLIPGVIPPMSNAIPKKRFTTTTARCKES
jgi:hypothetical protein